MSVTNRFPLWGKLGESPTDGFEYDGGDQVNEKHLNYLWDKIQKQTDDFITKTDDLQAQLDTHDHTGDTINPDSVSTGTLSGDVVSRAEAIDNLEGNLYLEPEGTDPSTVLENDGDMVFIHE